jgi:hypothetical protein
LPVKQKVFISTLPSGHHFASLYGGEGAKTAGAIGSRSVVFEAGGAEGSRTPDLLIANETLYQLSYDPIAKPTGFN